jgi:hypothetical protein
MPHQHPLAVPIGFADKTDVLLVGPFLAGSRLLHRAWREAMAVC